jgi:Asp-tRNA(Asn)/Glu-tRNA(Gln) amidotransferase A subunit family amidase
MIHNYYEKYNDSQPSLAVSQLTTGITNIKIQYFLWICSHLKSIAPAERPPLFGVPFAVKDNIDCPPYPTTAACRAFEYTPKQAAPAVQALLDAGAPFHCVMYFVS